MPEILLVDTSCANRDYKPTGRGRALLSLLTRVLNSLARLVQLFLLSGPISNDRLGHFPQWLGVRLDAGQDGVLDLPNPFRSSHPHREEAKREVQQAQTKVYTQRDPAIFF